MSTRGPNDHVTDYLDYYCNLGTAPNFAIMLRGGWGAGKTWFIKKYMSEKGEDGFLYVSLYGIKTYREIENEFFRQIHPFLSSTAMKVTGALLKGTLKGALKVDLNGNEHSSGTLTLDPKDLPSHWKNTSKRILVFDDLERSGIPVAEIMGYINNLVEHSNLKAIILANETEINTSMAGLNNPYILVKEKLVGKSFNLLPDFDNSIQVFLSELKDPALNKILSDRIPLLREIFVSAGYNNLRHLRQSILDFERFNSLLPSKVHEIDILQDHIISLFFAISFELRKGEIRDIDFDRLYKNGTGYRKQNKPSNDPLDRIRAKYKVFEQPYHPIGERHFRDFFAKGTTSEKSLAFHLDSSGYFGDLITPDWIRLWRHEQLEDQAFADLRERAYQQLSGATIDDKTILVHTACTLIYLCENGLAPYAKAKIVELAMTNLKKLLQGKTLTLELGTPFPGEAGNLFPYHGQEIRETKRLLNMMRREVEQTEISSLPLAAMKLLEDLPKYIAELAKQMTTNEKGVFDNKPILAHTNHTAFVQEVIKLSNQEKNTLARIIAHRYSSVDNLTALASEAGFLKAIVPLLKQEAKEKEGQISGWILTSQLIPVIENSIKLL